MALISNGRRQQVPAEQFSYIAAGTMATTDLEAARLFYEQFLGFDCVRYAADRMLIRDVVSRRAMQHSEAGYLVIDVEQVPTISHPQNFLNHWGLTVPSTGEVDRIHAEAEANKERYGIRKVRKITNIHAAYGFYFADRDMNWWEIESRVHGRTNEMVFDDGDFGAKPELATTPSRQQAYGVPERAHTVVHESALTHGTLETRDLERSRAIYENVLGLRCVRHSPPAQLIAGRGDVMLVCVGSGEALHEQDSINRWVLLTNDSDAVMRSHREASEQAERLGIRKVGAVTREGDVRRFILQDADSNWWEVTSLPRDHYESIFRRGDI